MSFKEILKSDVSAVFLDPDEFGEKHSINGKTAIVVIDDDLSDDTVNISISGTGTRGNSGLYNNQKNLYISTKDLPGKPKVNSYIEIDEKRYMVRASSVQDGIYKVTLEVVGGR